tara:strand:- start:1303 stop:1656 length:354 start_codon:yes stop_codon:yes gene_type:complete
MNSYKNKYSQATKIFQILCRKYLISPDEYGEKYRRGSRDCIRSILSGSFDETFWFTLPKKRFDIAREKFKNILVKKNHQAIEKCGINLKNIIILEYNQMNSLTHPIIKDSAYYMDNT